MKIKFLFILLFLGVISINAHPSSGKKIKESTLTAGISCKTLGYRWGYTARATMLGNKTKSEWDFSIPIRCRGKVETEEGIKSGVYAASR